MADRKSGQEELRKTEKLGGSLAITLPVAYVRKLGWKAKQKLVVKLRGKKVVVEDWEK